MMLDISMEPTRYNVDQITIRDKLPLDVITDQTKTIIDFILEEKYIVSLEVKKSDRTKYLTLYNYNGHELYNLSLKGISRIESLYRSCLGGTYIVAKDNVYKFIIAKEKLILEIIEKRIPFDKYTRNCLSSNKDYIYIKSYQKRQQQVKITAFNKKTKRRIHFGQIMDSLNYQRMTDPYSPELTYQRIAPQNTKTIHMVNHKLTQPLRRLEASADFYSRKFHIPVDFDFISSQGSVYVIDHLNNQINKFTENGVQLSTISIPNFDQDMEYIVDQTYGALYALEKSARSKDIYSIDLDSGEHTYLGALKSSFVNAMKIRNRILVFTNSGLTMQDQSKVLNIITL